jgi:hypothetical protein
VFLPNVVGVHLQVVPTLLSFSVLAKELLTALIDSGKPHRVDLC